MLILKMKNKTLMNYPCKKFQFKGLTKSFFLLLTIYYLLLSTYSFSQTVYEPINSSVYDFLDRMAQKGLIEFHDEIRPVSREYIAEKLMEVKRKAQREKGSEAVRRKQRSEIGGQGSVVSKEYGEISRQ